MKIMGLKWGRSSCNPDFQHISILETGFLKICFLYILSFRASHSIKPKMKGTCKWKPETVVATSQLINRSSMFLLIQDKYCQGPTVLFLTLLIRVFYSKPNI